MPWRASEESRTGWGEGAGARDSHKQVSAHPVGSAARLGLQTCPNVAGKLSLSAHTPIQSLDVADPRQGGTSLGEAGLCSDSVVSHQLPTHPSTGGINTSILERFQ